ncbi:uncharacterized protein HMPREF1541_09176 [Cyphellophora europaea CBS 101466]|uniref:DUF7514 domain-containing protein n=1 Tax=Cyphellophora europaea (strain CBS 101466) TaxID=1220924 RepID=W2S9M4_CYPE1|nr:uncharacterized protein HMPREF1541_09176 [Cyphellophora europaea CBS 101466]ETN45345.1 hypothetical protein HMPREF1541_09176 [Cyphellophora europaea CBS 101466]
MDQNGDSSAFRWKYLIKQDKTATQQLEDLCIGLAKCIVTNEDGIGPELTPQRLAAFYRRVGGNYDTLFLKSGDNGLSFIYKTFGCFHSLQPTHTPFEIPCIPCLTPHGFARWQTLQLLLSPDESVDFLQKAVQIYRIPRPDGGTFPTPLPKSCFPSQPDPEMEDWYNNVTGHLNQDNYMRRLKHSPYQSPYPEDRKDGYFQNGSRNSSAEDQARIDAYRRRSSVPDAISSVPVAIPVPVPVDLPEKPVATPPKGLLRTPASAPTPLLRLTVPDDPPPAHSTITLVHLLSKYPIIAIAYQMVALRILATTPVATPPPRTRTSISVLHDIANPSVMSRPNVDVTASGRPPSSGRTNGAILRTQATEN